MLLRSRLVRRLLREAVRLHQPQVQQDRVHQDLPGDPQEGAQAPLEDRGWRAGDDWYLYS